MDEIIKIVLKRNKERKLLTSRDVKTICRIVLKKKGYDFIKKVEVVDHAPNDSNCAGVCYKDNIFFFFREVVDLIQEQTEDFMMLNTMEGTIVDVYNYYYLNIIFHELAHVRQFSIIDSKYDSLEKKIFSIFLPLRVYDKFYNDNYNNILTEVNANNVAMVTTNYIYSKLPPNFITHNDWNIYQETLLKTLLYNNYEIMVKSNQVVSPAEKVICNFDDEIFKFVFSLGNTSHHDFEKILGNNPKLTIYKKLMLGLPISYLEYAYGSLIAGRLESDDEINVVKKLQKKI